ncbi:hypothetical protein K1T71_002550 [Dendrolimus kikuchii]|uniref:Uncharacterized protein n=1 Tax=Dendrolimus kikuchii TaxID=765133 RepID=A0ACC1DDX9_9NEOP|nr:hypothetical protein K1T71_002550 [Dendrolimus kikuchii]
MPHNHSHCDHDHDHTDPEEIGIQYNLFEKIDKENLQCLNESVEGSGKTVFKPWSNRLDRSSFVESDADEELLFNIPFTGNVKLKGIKISSEDSECHPTKLRFWNFQLHTSLRCSFLASLFNFLPTLPFSNTFVGQTVLSYSPGKVFVCRIVTFSSVSHLTMHFPSNFGAENTRIYYIGLKGEWTPGHRHGVTICTYEARPMLDDHKLKHLDSVSKPIE